MAVAVGVALLGVGIWLGVQTHLGSHSPDVPSARGRGNEQDALAAGSEGRTVSGQPDGNGYAHDVLNEAKRKAAEAQAQAAAEEQQAALQEAQRELQAKAAEQAANEKRLQEEQARLEAERQRAAETAAEAERQKAAAEAARQAAVAERVRQLAAEQSARAHVYQGPSSGEIVWRGEVRGTSLVTIEGNSSDTGQVVSGGLPGVLVMVQPMDAKHVGVAGTPAPSNGFRRLVLRVQGNGLVQEVIHWSVP